MYKIITKKCPTCGVEYFLALVKDKKVVYSNERIEALTHCPNDGTPLDFNIHYFQIGGSDFIIDYTKKCPVCKFEIDLYDGIPRSHKLVKKSNIEESDVCPVCGSKLYVSHHLIVRD